MPERSVYRFYTLGSVHTRVQAVWPDLAKFWKTLAIYWGLILLWAKFWTFFGKKLFSSAKFHCCKWPKLKTWSSHVVTCTAYASLFHKKWSMFIRPPTTLQEAFIGVASAYGPSPQPTACRSPRYGKKPGLRQGLNLLCPRSLRWMGEQSGGNISLSVVSLLLTVMI